MTESLPALAVESSTSERDLSPALYDVVVRHSRRAPITNRFRYRASYWLVDYDQLPQARGVVGRLVRFDANDHCDVHAIMNDHGLVVDRVVMLTMARTLGYVFNPISVFWCYDAQGSTVAVLADVHNTYGQRHTYVLRSEREGVFTVNKEMYVSPFYPVDGRYDIRVSEPGETISVSVTLTRGDEVPFVATLFARRRRANLVGVMRASFARPAIRVAILIRWQALRMWARGLRVQPR